MRVKESEKAGLKPTFKKLRMASGPIISWQIEGGNVEADKSILIAEVAHTLVLVTDRASFLHQDAPTWSGGQAAVGQDRVRQWG